MTKGAWRNTSARPARKAAEIDTTVAHPARVYNYWLGGKDNYPADRVAAEAVIRTRPEIITGVRANRAFLGRVVRYVAREAGIRQFLDVGTGIPAANNTHEVAQAVAPESRIVYVDNDPIVLTHARALLTSTREGATAYLDVDLRDPEKILTEAAGTLDFTRPVAVILLAILQLIPDSEEPAGIVRRLTAAAAPGSYLAISHMTADGAPDQVARAVAVYNAAAPIPVTARTHAEVSSFFDGLELVRPGVVFLPEWHPDGLTQGTGKVDLYGGVARKP
jgi:S-adenosyl methyltransferase